MNSLAARVLFSIGVRLRNPSLWKEYRALKASEFATLQHLRQLQLIRLKSFLTFVGRYSPYYRDLFQQIDFHPEELSSIEELTQIPTIAKSQLIEFNDSIHSTYPFKRLKGAETSGTSGVALEFQRTEQWDSVNRANVMRGYDWYGVNVWDSSGYLWGYNIGARQSKRIRWLDSLQNRIRLFQYDDDSITKFASDISGASYIAGYSSAIYEVAKKINRLQIPVPHMRMVKGTSEMILDVYQPEVERAFGRRMISEYGAAESGLIAFECPAGNMHINMESVIVEVDDNNEIIVTNLYSHSFPIIRYRLGDEVKLSSTKCVCGRHHTILEEVIGRRGGNVQGTKNSYPALSFYYVFKNIAIEDSVLLNYKVLQSEKGRILITIENDSNKKFEPLVEAQLSRYFGEDIVAEFEYVSGFSSQQKKRQYFESTLKDSEC